MPHSEFLDFALTQVLRNVQHKNDTQRPEGQLAGKSDPRATGASLLRFSDTLADVAADSERLRIC